jgi:hypothetical protein
VVRPVGPFHFASLISTQLSLLAELDILVLRPQEPGSLLGHQGDLDNRLKTLLDALKVPTTDELVPGDGPDPNEVPFHCLLEDDALVSRLSVETDRWLEDSPPSHVSLIISVTTRPTLGTWANIGLT